MVTCHCEAAASNLQLSKMSPNVGCLYLTKCAPVTFGRLSRDQEVTGQMSSSCQLGAVFTTTQDAHSAFTNLVSDSKRLQHPVSAGLVQDQDHILSAFW